MTASSPEAEVAPRSALALVPLAVSALLIAAEAGQRAVDVWLAPAVAHLAREGAVVPRRLVACRSSRGWLHPSRTTTTCLRDGLTVPVRWTRVVWHGRGPDHVEREWEEPECPTAPFFSRPTQAVRCSLLDPEGTHSPRERWLRASLAPGGVTLLRCDVDPSGASPPAWAVGLRERPRRRGSWVALASAIVAVARAAASPAARRGWAAVALSALAAALTAVACALR